MNKTYKLINKYLSEDIFGSHVNKIFPSDKENYDVEDLKYSDEEEYETHFPFPTDIFEQEIPEEEKEKKDVLEEPPMETPTTEPEEVPGTEAGTPSVGAVGMPMDQGMGVPAMPSEEEPKDPEYIGRIYELKKIYSRLVSIESFLDDASDSMLLRLRNYISSAIELFQTLIANLDEYKDKIDDIIIVYYKFLMIVYTLLKKFYERDYQEDKEEKGLK